MATENITFEKLEQKNHIKGKIFKLYLEDPKNPKILITYKVDRNKQNLLKNDIVCFWKDSSGKKRFSGTYPLIFVRNDIIKEKDLSTLNLANQIDSYFEYREENNQKTLERQIISFYKELKGDKKWNNYSIETIDQVETDLILKKPHHSYTLFEKETFINVAREIQIEATLKTQKNK